MATFVQCPLIGVHVAEYTCRGYYAYADDDYRRRIRSLSEIRLQLSDRLDGPEIRLDAPGCDALGDLTRDERYA